MSVALILEIHAKVETVACRAVGSLHVIASEAKQSTAPHEESWIASSRSLSSGAHSRDPLVPRK
jgi:hypothetical protein